MLEVYPRALNPYKAMLPEFKEHKIPNNHKIYRINHKTVD